MIALNLSEHEREILAQVLKSCLADLRLEIADPDSSEFRHGLEARQAVVTKVLEGIGRPVRAAI